MILVIDNYDSFTYNLVQYLGQCGSECVVFRNDEIDLDRIRELQPDGILLSPGPCTPDRSGICINILEESLGGRLFDARAVPILGVCLGMQAMGLVSGSTVSRAEKIMHGKSSMVRHDELGVFEKVPNPFSAIRYHSLTIKRETLPQFFEITATAEDDGEVMGIRHRDLPIEGVQFHPESVLTEHGIRIVQNFVARVASQAQGT